MAKLKSPEEHFLRFLQLYMPWINDNELKQDIQSYEDRLCNIKKHEPYMDIDHEELQNFNFLQLDEEEDNAEFSKINPNLLDLDFHDTDDSDSVSNATAVSTINDNLLHPCEQFYKFFLKCMRVNSICSIL